MEKPKIIINVTDGVVQEVLHNIPDLQINVIDFNIEGDFEENIRVLNFKGDLQEPCYIYQGDVGTYLKGREIDIILDDKVLYGEKAKEFFEGALEELSNKDTDPSFLNREIGGLWYDEGDDMYIAFDNSSGNLNVEEFDSEVEALKYAQGIEAMTRHGYKI